MGLFGRKKSKEEEYDDEDDLEEEESPKSSRGKYAKRLASKNFKDLNPADRRKRTEPLKPWGKKERLIILSLIAMTTLASSYLALSAREFKLPGIPRIKMPEIALPAFFREETIVLEGNAKDTETSNMAENEFNQKTKDLSGVYGLYVIRTNSGYSYGVNEYETFLAASLIKLPVMVGMYMEEERGNLSLSTKYKLKQSDKLPGSGSLSGRPVGYELTYKNIIRLMGKESDNTAFNIARKHLGDTRIKEIMEAVGMKRTSIKTNETTPEDIGTFFNELLQGNVISKDHADELLSYLTDTKFENWLSAGLPEDVKFAHKYGREVHVVNDAGVVLTEKPYVVVVMSKGIVDQEADQIFPELSRLVYEAESGN